MLVTIVATLALSPQKMHHHSMHQHKRVHAAKAADTTAADEKAIRAVAHKVERCFETKNLKMFRTLVTSNCQQEMPDHKVMNLKDSMAQMRKDLAPLSDIKCVINIQNINITGRTATVDDRFNMVGKFTDKKGKHTMKVEGSETVSVKKVGGNWLGYYDKIHDQSVAVDGHVVSHMP